MPAAMTPDAGVLQALCASFTCSHNGTPHSCGGGVVTVTYSLSQGCTSGQWCRKLCHTQLMQQVLLVWRVQASCWKTVLAPTSLLSSGQAR